MTGDDSDIWWSGTYVDRHGTPLAMYGAKAAPVSAPIRQHELRQSRWEPWIAEATTNILRAAGHRGLAFAEFKRDARDGQYKLTEVTAGRTWFPHALVTRAGYNLPLMMYRNVLGLSVETPPPYTQGLKWIPRSGTSAPWCSTSSEGRPHRVVVAQVVPRPARLRVRIVGRSASVRGHGEGHPRDRLAPARGV